MSQFSGPVIEFPNEDMPESIDAWHNNSAQIEEEFRVTVNRNNAESISDTPDFILAAFLLNSLGVLNSAIKARDKFYGRPCGDGAALDYNRRIKKIQQGIPTSPYGGGV